MKVVFLDRDGVINKYPGHGEYVKSWKEFHFLPRVKAALRLLQKEGHRVFIVSNQAGVSKGLYSKDDLKEISRNLTAELKKSGVALSGIYYCTHAKEKRCGCRKPKTGMIKKAISNLRRQGLKFSASKSYFIGDTIKDIETGRNAGLKTILVFSGREKARNKPDWQINPDYAARDLFEAVKKIIIKHK
ncbi:MAG: HAD family hydrolase [Candidatus Omnitrophica bacterium]|nr:HAD family hydrolase [Candidatus Omnitrophota bacterium]